MIFTAASPGNIVNRRNYQPKISAVIRKRMKDGRWKLAANHPGRTHFCVEKTGWPRWWNTMRALWILKHFANESKNDLLKKGRS
jgi:hypothetical protein